MFFVFFTFSNFVVFSNGVTFGCVTSGYQWLFLSFDPISQELSQSRLLVISIEIADIYGIIFISFFAFLTVLFICSLLHYIRSSPSFHITRA